ncbi:MAG TPA: BMP family ABC transporter substrate-binding protein [Solirubrobacteraceae bacterium]|nr:BMP family ABC transporter substrate-binding protein [Solirubrobacteraceae bacterium]
MTARMARLGAAFVGVVVVAVVLAACGSSSSTTSTKSGGSTSATTTPKSSFKVGLVTDIGGLNDRGFNHLAYVGLLTAEKQLGIQGRVLTSSSGADYLPNLTTLAQQGYNLVIPVGFLMAAATDSVAKQFPNVKFAMIDSDATAEKGDPKNIEGLLFKEQQAGYLAGYLAGLYAKAHGYKTISSVGGQKIPPVDHYIAGYQAGAKKADPGIKTLNGYSQDFVDQTKCKQIALNQIQQGSKVVFQVAGACGLGALSAAQQAGVQGIGVDADQSYLGSYILTSAEKKVDVAVVNAIKNAMAGTFAAGANVTNDISNGGIGYGKIGPAGLKFAPQIAKIYSEMKSGKIANIPDTVP